MRLGCSWWNGDRGASAGGSLRSFGVALSVCETARRSRPAGGHFLLLAQKKVTKEEGLNTICLADVATDLRLFVPGVGRGRMGASSRDPFRERRWRRVLVRPPSSVLPAGPCPGGRRRAWRAPRSTGRAARARSAPRDLTCRRLFERRERSEQSELGDRAARPSTAGQSQRSADRPGPRADARLGAARLARSQQEAAIERQHRAASRRPPVARPWRH